MSAPSRGAQSLESLLNGIDSIVELLRNSQAGPNVYPGVPAEYTNWRDEQRSWPTTPGLFNQSYHMAALSGASPDPLAPPPGLPAHRFSSFAVATPQPFLPSPPL